MKSSISKIKLLFCFFAMIMLILDSKTAAHGASKGVTLCLYTVIPSIFPAMVISDYMINNLPSGKAPILSRIFNVCGLPQDTSSLFLAGALGGYPIGARLLGLEYRTGKYSKAKAENALEFCSNAGPAFIFGICGIFFSSVYDSIMLWIIHILSAILAGICLCTDADSTERNESCKKTPFAASLINCVKSMGIVCGWIIFFKVIIQFLDRWIFWILPSETYIVIAGILELINGITSLHQIENYKIRFIFCSVMLALGGLCVLMQTASVINGLSTAKYIRGKLLQAIFSALLSFFAMTSASESSIQMIIPIIMIALGIAYSIKKTKKYVAFRKTIVYNIV